MNLIQTLREFEHLRKQNLDSITTQSQSMKHDYQTMQDQSPFMDYLNISPDSRPKKLEEKDLKLMKNKFLER